MRERIASLLFRLANWSYEHAERVLGCKTAYEPLCLQSLTRDRVLLRLRKFDGEDGEPTYVAELSLLSFDETESADLGWMPGQYLRVGSEILERASKYLEEIGVKQEEIRVV